MPSKDLPLTPSVRGSRCVDPWDVSDLHELAAIRAQVAAFDAQTAAIALAVQRDERRDRRRRARDRERRR